MYSFGIVAIELLTGSNDKRRLAKCPAPQAVKDLLLQMTASAPQDHPNINEIQRRVWQILDNDLKDRIKKKLEADRLSREKHAFARALKAKEKKRGFGLGVAFGLGAGAALAAYILGRDRKEWDEDVQRYRRPNGQFASD